MHFLPGHKRADQRRRRADQRRAHRLHGDHLQCIKRAFRGESRRNKRFCKKLRLSKNLWRTREGRNLLEFSIAAAASTGGAGRFLRRKSPFSRAKPERRARGRELASPFTSLSRPFLTSCVLYKKLIRQYASRRRFEKAGDCPSAFRNAPRCRLNGFRAREIAASVAESTPGFLRKVRRICQ